MKIGSFSAYIQSLAYYIFIGATNSAKKDFFGGGVGGGDQLKAYFFPRTFFPKYYCIRSDEI